MLNIANTVKTTTPIVTPTTMPTLLLVFFSGTGVVDGVDGIDVTTGAGVPVDAIVPLAVVLLGVKVADVVVLIPIVATINKPSFFVQQVVFPPWQHHEPSEHWVNATLSFGLPPLCHVISLELIVQIEKAHWEGL